MMALREENASGRCSHGGPKRATKSFGVGLDRPTSSNSSAQKAGQCLAEREPRWDSLPRRDSNRMLLGTPSGHKRRQRSSVQVVFMLVMRKSH
jgi:hypothetical protein